MAELCMRLWGLQLSLWQLNLWLMALLTGGISAAKYSPTNSTGSRCPAAQQQPRYLAARRNTAVHFLCSSREPSAVQWYRTREGSQEVQELDHNSSHYSVQRTGGYVNFTIFRVTYRDNGVYVCDSKDLRAQNRSPHLCGTELRVMGEWGAVGEMGRSGRSGRSGEE
ncbi:B-cell antigen receptor complex-associated protein beta chain [Melanerpes formicivorus]|uniref:B-cell antigen receptor complex-associated protein beta chain n=1 Tax=Melanerpes formicivorus TaxID=211600 RepID=UPI00358F381C